MISKKIFNGDGTTTRYLSDFMIRNENYARPYVYIYDSTLDPAGTEDKLVDGTTVQANWSWPDNIWKRGADVAQATDIVPPTYWEVVDSSISYYIAPIAATTVWIEVATTSEEFGDTLASESAEAAAASAAEAAISEINAAASAASIDPTNLLHTVGDGGGNPEGYTATEIDTELNTGFKRSFVDLLVVSSWSFVTTTITLNVLSGHGIIATDDIWLDGLISTTNAPNGEWTVSSVTATTIVFTATSTPTGTPTVLNAITYKTTYIDSLALGANPVAKIYHDGTVVGSTDYSKYEYNIYTRKAKIRELFSTVLNSGDTINLPLSLSIDGASLSNHASSNRITSVTSITATSVNARIVDNNGTTSTLTAWNLEVEGELT